MSDDIVSYVQSRLRLTCDLNDIRGNKGMLDAARTKVQERLKLLEGLARANQQMCEHKNRESYNDPRDPGWTCLDCGASR